jgi:hypothetical protein
VEDFVLQLADWAQKDRNALLCQLNSYARPTQQVDFLAGAHLDDGNPEILLNSISRYYKFLPGEQQQAFLENLREKAS